MKQQPSPTVPRAALTPLKISGPVFCFSPEATADDIKGYLEIRLQHLNALLYMTCGEGGDVLRQAKDDIQDNFMWACSTLADECMELALLPAARRQS